MTEIQGVPDRTEDCLTCGAKAGEPCDPTALEDFDQDGED
jgi:hypothetical protein